MESRSNGARLLRFWYPFCGYSHERSGVEILWRKVVVVLRFRGSTDKAGWNGCCLSSSDLGVCLFAVLCLGGLLLLWVCVGGGRSSGLGSNVESLLKA